MPQLHCNRRSDIAHCLTFLRRSIGDPHMFSRSDMKVAEGFAIISNLAVLRVMINYSRANFFLK